MSTWDAIFRLKGYDLIIEPHRKLELNSLKNMISYDPKFKLFRTLPYHFEYLWEFLKSKKYRVKVDFEYEKKLSFETQLLFELRQYQKDAIDKWIENSLRGIVVLPPGAGKTFIGLYAIHKTKLRTLIVVPTINLMHQWKQSLMDNLEVKKDKIGLFGGGEKIIEDITVTTYDSGYLYVKLFQTRFGLLLFDEVHHLPTPSYRLIAEGMITPNRLGLSATPERSDELHVDLDDLVGKVVFRISYSDLREEGYVADYRLEKIYVDLSEEELKRYSLLVKKYRNYLNSKNLTMFSAKDFKKLIFRVGYDKKAREALLSHNEARQIALNAKKKIEIVEELLNHHSKDKVIIFSEYNDVVNEIGRKFFIPTITHKTKLSERENILDNFRQGKYSKIVTGRVLDEGWDVHAQIGIMVSGSSSKRQFIQRLGRLLRPKEEEALLYELVTRKTSEMYTSKRRKSKEP